MIKYLEKYPEEVRKEVLEYFEKLKSKTSIKGRSEKAIIGSILYYVLKERGTPKNFNEIAEELGVEAREIKRNYLFFTRALGIKVLPVDPKLYVERFCNEMKMSEKVKKKAIEILEKVMNKGIHIGVSESAVASAVIFIASKLEGEDISQRLLAEFFKISESTVRKFIKIFADELKIKIPETKKEKKEWKIKSIDDLAKAIERFTEDIAKREVKFKIGNIGVYFFGTNDLRIIEIADLENPIEIGNYKVYRKYKISIMLRNKKIEFETHSTTEKDYPEFKFLKNIDRIWFKIADGVKLYLERKNFWLEVSNDYSIDVNSSEYVLDDFRVYNKENHSDTKIWLRD